MIPNNKIVSEYIESDFIYDNYEEDLKYKQPGNIDIQTTTHSPTYQMWEMYYENNVIKLKSLTNNKNYIIKSVTDVKKLTFSFTLNMNVTYSYTKDDKVFLVYYDSIEQQDKEVVYENISHPTIIYDDYRYSQTSSSDVLFFYINKRTLKLCYRLLRDRFTVEYELYSVSKNTKIVRIGMADNFRLKFKLQNYG